MIAFADVQVVDGDLAIMPHAEAADRSRRRTRQSPPCCASARPARLISWRRRRLGFIAIVLV
jgi:hypothetical protein